MTENELRKIIREEVERYISHNSELSEGVNIDKGKLIVSFDASHQSNVDTNDYIHPYIIKNNIRNETVLSIFERKDNEMGNDGNPLVYALKGIKGWKFNNPKYDILALLKRFVAVTTQLHQHFDTLIIIPSSNQLNRTIFSYLIRLINFEAKFSGFFRKLSVEEVVDNYYNPQYFDRISSDEDEIQKMREDMGQMFTRMKLKNNGIFSYKFIHPLTFRDAIEQSMVLDTEYTSTIKYSQYINGKNVLILDDTIASGKTLSDAANAIRDTFAPSSITFLTVFSPKSSQGFENTREML